MREDLKGKTALITGAGKKTGIGYAIAERLASLGCHVVIADLGRPPETAVPVRTGTKEEMEAIASEISGRCGVKAIAVELDVTDPASVARMAESLRERCGHIHILVNNAGASFGVPADILSYDEAAWIRTVDVCLFSVFRVSRAIVPLMLGEPGAIVNTASRAGKVPPLFNSAYAAAKAGVIMLTKTMAGELAPQS
jgi:NAD(P)-dependent dehydrogenase (short-subunit alcohol dehydrogenase family)